MKSLLELHDIILAEKMGNILAAVDRGDVASFKRASVYFLMNFTINPIEPFLRYYLHESNLRPELVFGNYDNVMQDVLNNDSLLYTRSFDVIVCALHYDPLDAAFAKKLSDTSAFIAELTLLFDAIKQKTASFILVNTLIPPFTSNKYIHSEAIAKINHFIRDYVKQQAGRFILMDWTRYLQTLGEKDSMDYRYWYLYKAPFKKAFLSYYARDITSVLRTLNGFSKKCLILDCDNTLWGGIIGEDGLTGIQLDNHTHPGKIFYDFQQCLLELATQGVILALCSKNNEADVWQVFENHPHSLLRREHFATHRINWLDKASNIADIIQELNIGIDSVVFVDDNPTECEWVKSALPELTVVPALPSSYTYPSILFQHGFFNTFHVNPEDTMRNTQYQEEAKRKDSLKKIGNMTEYLTSLELIATIHPVTEKDIPRAAQLTQKTNQFNLSTRRYSEKQIKALADAENSAVFTLSVQDKFGHYGLTGVFIAKRHGTVGVIDTFLLSCRILSRSLEYVFIEQCLKQLNETWGTTTWLADYLPTEKNAQIKDFLLKAGFQDEGNQQHRLDTSQWLGYAITYIKVIHKEIENARIAS